MRRLLEYVRDNAVLFGFHENTVLHLRLRAPWRPTLCGRGHYEVFEEGAPFPGVIIRDCMPLKGTLCTAVPACFPPEAGGLLPKSCGLFQWGESPYAWEAFVPGISLFEEVERLAGAGTRPVKSLLTACAGEVLKSQAEKAVVDDGYAPAVISSCFSRMDAGTRHVFREWVGASAVTRDWLNPGFVGTPLPCSWGHGDMWGKDIFRRPDGFTLIDWEWAGEGMPVGADVIDYYVTGLEHLLHRDTEQAWNSLLNGGEELFEGVRYLLEKHMAGAGLDRSGRFALYVYALLRQAGKAIAQDGIRAGEYLVRLNLVRDRLLSAMAASNGESGAGARACPSGVSSPVVPRPERARKNIARLQTLLVRKESRMPIPGELLAEDGNGAFLALTGKDWHALSEDAVRGAGKPIGGILALDDEAAVLSLRCGIRTSFVEDVLGAARTCELSILAQKRCREWFTPLREYGERDGVCWPELDQTALRWFWQEAMLGNVAARAVTSSGRELLVVTRTPYAVPLFYYGEDNFGRGAAASGCDGVFLLSAPAMRRTPPPAQKEPYWPLDDLKRDVEGKIVCILNPFEIERSREVLLGLERRFPGGVCVLSVEEYKKDVFEGIRVYSTPCTTGLRDVNMFSDLAQWGAPGGGEPLGQVWRRALSWYCAQRWPSLHRTFLRFKELLERYRPRCIMGTDLDDAESQLPYAVARQIGVPSLAWGHAKTNVFRNWREESAGRIMVPTRYGWEAARLAGIPRERIVSVKGMFRDNLYPCREGCGWPQRREEGCLRVLALPVTTRIPGTAIVQGGLRMQAKHTAELANPPVDLKNRLDVRFKHHPWMWDRSVFLLNGMDEEKWSFDPKQDLKTLLAECDLCVLMGESYDALLEACSRVPTVLLTEDQLCFWERGMTQAALEYYPFVCRCLNEVWEIARGLLHEPGRAARMLEKQRSLAEPYGTPTDWLDVVEESCRKQ